MFTFHTYTYPIRTVKEALSARATTLAGETWFSKGANSPFIGHCLPGAVRYTLVDGHIVYQAA